MAVTFDALAVNNPCYQAAQPMPEGRPEGIVVHSTGANNPWLRRYVNAPDIAGENIYKNYYDRPDWQACPHAVIGRDKDGKVRAAKLLPYDICCWNSSSGSKGSYNYSPAYLQFEICEDGLYDEDYFAQAFGLAAQLCREWCDEFDIPLENVVSHKEAHALGYANNHADPDHWLAKFGRDMNWFRSQVESFRPSDKLYRVQIGAFRSYANAAAYLQQAKADGYSAFIVEINE